MRRVPVMIKNDYLEKLFENLPVLFVDNYSDVSEELLAKNNHLFEDALTFDVRRLDLNVLFSEKVECCLKNR